MVLAIVGFVGFALFFFCVYGGASAFSASAESSYRTMAWTYPRSAAAEISAW